MAISFKNSIHHHFKQITHNFIKKIHIVGGRESKGENIRYQIG
ncbi:MAG: hypothetical protein XD88_1528 [Methanocalculus sp. 52_23]|nr:MAG: hypothetical protein XD88_1528 [Methanocalculus sp. 52_23]